ncbi:MAG: hypothetical protein OXH86_14435 [Acidimicrobiaceae bacterium]|nr:hypothetical protein [Acidimicrobiaceae bacterium]
MTAHDAQLQAPPPLMAPFSAADGRDAHERVSRTAQLARERGATSPDEALALAAVAVDESLASFTERLADDPDAPDGTPTLSPWWIRQLARCYCLTKDQAVLLRSFDRLCRDPDSAADGGADRNSLFESALELAEQVVEPGFETQDELAEWFLTRFETPEEARLAPSSNGPGWEWADRGPFDATDVLKSRFAQLSPAQESHIADAVRLLEGSGTQWARKVDFDPTTQEPSDESSDLRDDAHTVGEGRSRPVAPIVAFGHSGLVQRHDLARLVGLHESQTVLPWLVRQLIHTTTSDLRELHFPDAEGIRKTGFDGVVDTVSGNAWVPDGHSVWELSTTKSPQRKSQSDFDKSTAEVPAGQRQGTTYITVQLAEWSGAKRWREQRQAESKWRDVRAYDVDDLVAWLEAAPSVWFLLSERLGINTSAVVSARSWWRKRLESTRIPLGTGILLAGREAESARLRARIDAGNGQTTIVAPSADEAIEFALAAILKGVSDSEAPPAAVDHLLDQCLVVSDEAEWRRLAAQSGTLILIPASPELARIEGEHNHHILLPVARHHDTVQLNPNILSNDDCVTVPPVNASAVADALAACGEETGDAHRWGAIARRNLTALRRTLAVDPLVQRPPWARHDPGSVQHAAVNAALLAGSWREYGDDAQPSSDRDVLVHLANPSGDHPYETLALVFDEVSKGPDPLLERTARGWRLIHPVDAWQTHGDPSQAPGVPERIADLFIEVLSEPDPVSDLGEFGRFTAPMFGIGRKYSSDLRHGVATTLAILGAGPHRAHDLQDAAAAHWRNWASAQVHRVLTAERLDADDRPARDPAQVWMNSADLLPLLAEARPHVFLAACRDGLDVSGERFREQFRDSEDRAGFFGTSSPHTGLVWALETLAWSTEFFGEAVDLLARLAELDPGGRLGNRPSGSLWSIFCLWMPQTSADQARREQVLKVLLERHPAIAWELIPSLPPEPLQTLIPTRRPLFGAWSAAASQPTYEAVALSTDAIGRLLIEAASSPDLLWNVTDIANRLPTERRDDIWHRWREFTSQDSPHLDEARARWADLDELSRRHRSFEDADWALPTDDIDQLEAIAQALRPADTVITSSWLFAEWHPDLGNCSPRDDFDDYKATLDQRRAEAVGTTFDNLGLEGVFRLALGALEAGGGDAVAVGMALARSTQLGASADSNRIEKLAGVESELVEWAAIIPEIGDLDASSRKRAADGFYLIRGKTEDVEPIEQRVRDEALSPAERAALLNSWDKYPDAWEMASSLGPETEAEYWRRFTTWGLGDFEYAEVAAEHLLEVGRADAAVDLLGSYPIPDDAITDKAISLAFQALHSVPKRIAQNAGDGMLRHLIAKLHKWMWRAAKADGEVAGGQIPALELPSPHELGAMEVGLLAARPDCIKPRFLLRLMADNASVFVDLVSIAFTPDETSADSSAEAQDADNETASAIEPEAGDELDQPLVAALQSSPGLAFSVLRSWRTVPGSQRDGSIDATALNGWIDEARRLLAKRRRLDIGDEYIGHALAGAQVGDDEIRIPRAVRDALEHCRSKYVDSGLRLALSNDETGGAAKVTESAIAEHEAAATRFSDQAVLVADRWPRSAHVLRDLAEGSRAQARWYREILNDRA